MGFRRNQIAEVDQFQQSTRTQKDNATYEIQCTTYISKMCMFLPLYIFLVVMFYMPPNPRSRERKSPQDNEWWRKFYR